MAKENHCPQCGAELTPDAPEGLCPRCLMEVGLENDAGVTIESPGVIEGPGTTIGRYKLLELIGEGGMGLVYLAEQQEPVKRRVALKIIKPGMDTKRVIARFEAERQTLALLDHANIARVFDAGATDAGRPYFVMEHVKGMSINKYCDRHKLSIEQRLKLFLQVCYAVHHAHQKGIIHRDIKPSNILVSVQDDRPVPKIIDFGIAKAVTQPLTEQTLFTRQGQLLGTPEYMSPEQADMANQDIDTRADIYSLGVVLYELLAGALPFEHEVLEKLGFAELQRILQEEEPPRPSLRFTALGEEAKKIAERRHTQVVSLARRLHRELEWIPLKAMRKERSRRYRSASELADDIQNYLNGAPLIAGPETAIYHVKKFVRKHAGSVATVLLVAVALILGFVVSTTMYLRAEQARARAEKAEKLAEERAEDYRRALYCNRIGLADAMYHEGNVTRVRELLDLCPEDLRGWEWYRLQHVRDQASMTLAGHQGYVTSVAFDRDDSRIVSGSRDGTIKIWDAATGTEIMTLRGHEQHVLCVALSQDGKRIASGSNDETIKVWDAATGDELMTLRGHKGATVDVSFSPDGQRIVSGSWDKTVKVWDTTTGTQVMTLLGHKDFVWCVTFSPDGNRILSGSMDKTIKVWDAASGDELRTLRGHKGWAMAVSFSPDGMRILSGSQDGTAKVWDAASGTELMTLRGHEGVIASVSFSPDGKRIATASGDRTIKLWDALTGIELATLRGHGWTVHDVEFGPDGKRLVSGSVDQTVKVWDLTTSREVMVLHGHKGSVGPLAFSPDGRHIVSGSSDATIKVWDAASGAELTTLRGHEDKVTSVAFSTDGRKIVSGSKDKTIKVWNATTGAEVTTLGGHKHEVTSVVFTPDGKRIVSASYDDTVKVWNATTGVESMTLSGHKDDVLSVVVTPDCRHIISLSWLSIKVWDAQTGAEVISLPGPESSTWCMAISPDGKHLVVGSFDGPVVIWDLESRTEAMILSGHKSELYDVAFSPDGRRIVSSDGPMIKLWDSASGTELMTLRRYGGWAMSVAFSPDGKSIAAGCKDGTIKLWDSASPEEARGKEKTESR